ncbi:MAG: hypothetical protein ABI273_21590 [Lacunisphaera sp.]
MICAVILVGALTGASAVGGAKEDTSGPSAPAVRRTFHRALREFDRFLDHHPLPEDDLRINPTLITDRSYLGQHTELNEFLAANPEVLRGLRVYPRYYLFRALLRQASIPVRYSEIAQLKRVFDIQPEVENALNRDPESIRSPTFLRAHAPLYDFINTHAILRNAFFSREDSLVQKS